MRTKFLKYTKKRLLKKILLAEDIISQVMADEESKWGRAEEKKVFHSLRLLNLCRKFWGMKPVPLMDPKKFKGCL
jgi:hypothetical protein